MIIITAKVKASDDGLKSGVPLIVVSKNKGILFDVVNVLVVVVGSEQFEVSKEIVVHLEKKVSDMCIFMI